MLKWKLNKTDIWTASGEKYIYAYKDNVFVVKTRGLNALLSIHIEIRNLKIAKQIAELIEK